MSDKSEYKHDGCSHCGVEGCYKEIERLEAKLAESEKEKEELLVHIGGQSKVRDDLRKENEALKEDLDRCTNTRKHLSGKLAKAYAEIRNED